MVESRREKKNVKGNPLERGALAANENEKGKRKLSCQSEPSKEKQLNIKHNNH